MQMKKKETHAPLQKYLPNSETGKRVGSKAHISQYQHKALVLWMHAQITAYAQRLSILLFS